MRVLVLLIGLLTITNVIAENITSNEKRQIDVVNANEVMASDIDCIQTFNDELIRVDDQRSLQLGETEQVGGYDLRLIDKVILKNPIRKIEKDVRATRRRKGNGSGGSH